MISLYPKQSYWRMDQALHLARKAYQRGEIPVGALVLSPENKIVAQAFNQVEVHQNPLAHAEMIVLKKACLKVKSKRLMGYSLVVTLEPCPMCAAAAMHARIARIVFGAYDSKGGGIEHGARIFSHQQTMYHPEIIGGVREHACQKLLRNFFMNLR